MQHLSDELITQTAALKLLSYDPQSGELRWQTYMGSRGLAGAIAGSFFTDQKGYQYIQVVVKQRHYYAHRLIWLMQTGEWPEQTDHINHDGTDNRWCNLRLANHLINSKNCRLASTNTSGRVGVYWDKANNKWKAQIKAQGKTHWLGRFASFTDAVTARKAAERQYGFHPNHGDSL